MHVKHTNSTMPELNASFDENTYALDGSTNYTNISPVLIFLENHISYGWWPGYGDWVSEWVSYGWSFENN